MVSIRLEDGHPCPPPGLGSARDRPDVRVSYGTVTVLARHAGFWRATALLRDQPHNAFDVLTPRTGDVTARALPREPYTSVGIDRGRALIIADKRLFLIGTD